MFDRDTKIPILSNGSIIDIRDHEYIKLSNSVYLFSIPVPHNRQEINEISIEHYFTDAEIKTEIDNKRLYLGNEFHSTGVYKGDEELYCRDKNKIGTIKIIEHETKSYVTKTDGTGDFSISKERFVECIQQGIPGFDTISFNEFIKIFTVLNKIKENYDSQSEA